ncbi:MFS transporter (plasmid) [Neorhizobium sp. DAR64861/K0K2]|uniref:MFS transporter n=1 Tax=Neorhizobium sp. DAR64861/K0K2 TaxID=3421956 RepID=UPI003D29B66E
MIVKLWLSTFLVTISNFYVYLSFSSEIYRSTGSSAHASYVFAAQWIFPITCFLIIENITRTYKPKIILYLSAVVSLIVYIIVVYIGFYYWFVIMSAILFGALESLMRGGRQVALKMFYSEEDLKRHVSSLASASYVGASAGGALFAAVSHFDTVQVAVPVICIAYISAALLALRLPEAAPSETKALIQGPSFRSFFYTLRGSALEPNLFYSLYSVLLVCGVLQGYHNVARAALPLSHLGGNESALGYLQFVAGSAIIGGVWFFKALSPELRSSDAFVRINLFVSCTAMVTSNFFAEISISYAIYAIYIFSFELLFIRFQTDLIVSAKASSFTVISAFQQFVVNLCMLLSVIVGGFAVDNIGLLATSLLFSAALLIFLAAKGWVQKLIVSTTTPECL